MENLVGPAGGSLRQCVAIAIGFALLFGGASSASAALPKAYSDGEMRRLSKVLASDAASAVNRFGYNVAIDGDTAVIGAYRDRRPAGEPSPYDYRGAVYVFVRHGGSWVQQAKLAPADLVSRDFATITDNSIAIDGDTLVFGVPAQSSAAGAVYVYTRTGTTWTLQQKLKAPDAAAADSFGQTVAISGGSIAIGVPGDDHFGGNLGFDFGGSVRIFTRVGTTWSQQAKLTVPPVVGERLGYSDLDLDSNTLVAGADGGGSVHAAGSAYVFTRSGITWNAATELRAAGGSASDDSYGRAVEIDGGTIMVAAPGHGSGSVYVYRRSGSAWMQEAEIPGGSGAGRVSLDGDTAVFAAPYATDAATGKLIPVIGVYRRTGTTWTQVRQLAGSDVHVRATRVAEFDTFVGVSGDSVVVGAPADDTFGEGTGSAYFFSLNEYKTAEETPLTVTAAHGVLANDYDADNDVLTPRLLDTSKLHGVLAFGAGGSFVYTPEKDFAGTAKATYMVTDGHGGTGTATITITVTSVNDAPVAIADTAACRTNASVAFNVVANDTDVDTAHALLTATGFSAPSVGTIKTLASGNVVYTPPAKWAGKASFTYRTSDGTALSPPATVTINVGSAPAGFIAPGRGRIRTGGSTTATFTVGEAGSYSFSATGDPVPALVWSGASLPVALRATSANGVGTIAGTPSDGTAGTYAVKLTAANVLGSAQISVRVVVLDEPADSEALPDAPEAPEIVPTAPSEEATDGLEATETVTPDETPTVGPGSGRGTKPSNTPAKPPDTITFPLIGDVPAKVVAAAPWCVGVFALLLATVGVFSVRRRREHADDEPL